MTVPEAMRIAVEDIERAGDRVRGALLAHEAALADSEGDHALVDDTMQAVVEAASDARDAASSVLRWASFKRGEARDA